MIIRVFKDAKDRQLGPKHRTYSRREFMERGIFTTTLTAALPATIANELMARAAHAAGVTCPATSTAGGSVVQVNGSGGGNATGSYFFSTAQMNSPTASALSLWGVAGNFSPCFSNGGVDASSAFGATVLEAPPGVTLGAKGQANTWLGALGQCSYGALPGSSPSDDGAGDNLGQWGALGSYRISGMNTDLTVNQQVTIAPWAAGMAAESVSGSPGSQSATSFAKGFGITPSANTNASLWTNTANAAASLGQAMQGLFGTASNGTARAGVSNSLTAATCGFLGGSVLASPTFGTGLFTATGISALTNVATVASLSASQQAMLAAFYQSSVGQIGRVFMNNSGADYHNQSVQTDIAPYDQNVGTQFAMWLLACMASNQPGVFICSTNGSPGPQGFQTVTITDPYNANATVTVNGNNAQGDDGGSYSTEQIVLFTPFGSTPPVLNSLGTIASDGTTSPASSITSVSQAIASLYFTGAQFLAGFQPSAFNVGGLQAKMTAANAAPVSLLG